MKIQVERLESAEYILDLRVYSELYEFFTEEDLAVYNSCVRKMNEKINKKTGNPTLIPPRVASIPSSSPEYKCFWFS